MSWIDERLKPLILFHLVACFACFAQQANQTQSSALTIQQFDGGSMITKMDKGAVNEGSALKRTFFVVNDPACPVQLSGMGVVSRYLSGDDFVFRLVGSATARESISAVEIDLVLLDLWGSRMRNLSTLAITEISTGSDVPRDSEWGASSMDAKQFMTSVSYVKQARTQDGKIWKADTHAILESLASAQLNISAGDLDSFTAWPAAQNVKPASGTAHN